MIASQYDTASVLEVRGAPSALARAAPDFHVVNKVAFHLLAVADCLADVTIDIIDRAYAIDLSVLALLHIEVLERESL